MAEMLILWILGLIVIAIGWGVIDRIVVPFKALGQSLGRSLQSPEWSKRLEIAVASLLAVAVISIMLAEAGDDMAEWAGLPALLIWAGGLWLIPFRFGAVEHYWLPSLVIAVILVLFWVRSSSSPSTGMHASEDVSTQQESDSSASLTGRGFLFWIFLIGLTVAAIARYTSDAVALNS